MKKLFIDMDGTLAQWQEGTPFEIVCESGYAAKLPINGNMVKATGLLVVYVPYGEKKSDFVLRHFGFKKQSVAFSNCFLLDDYTENLAAWVNDGGTPIKVFNGINGKNGTYRGAYTCSWLNAEQIKSDVLRAMKVRADDWVIDKIEALLQEASMDDGDATFDDLDESMYNDGYIDAQVACLNDILQILEGDEL